MTVEEAYAESVTKKRRSDRAFLVGIVVGIAAGAIATVLLNRAADVGEVVDDEPVVELQPALASDPAAATTRIPVVPMGSADGTVAQRASITEQGGQA